VNSPQGEGQDALMGLTLSAAASTVAAPHPYHRPLAVTVRAVVVRLLPRHPPESALHEMILQSVTFDRRSESALHEMILQSVTFDRRSVNRLGLFLEPSSQTGSWRC
jgi:hypothetical protein